MTLYVVRRARHHASPLMHKLRHAVPMGTTSGPALCGLEPAYGWGNVVNIGPAVADVTCSVCRRRFVGEEEAKDAVPDL